MANHPNHIAVTDAALTAQCASFQAAFAAERTPLLERYCMYGDLVYHATGEDKQHLQAYTHLPNGTMAMMGPKTINEAEVVGIYRAQYRYWFDRLAATISAGDIAAAAQFFGVVSHSLGDTSALPHALGDLGLSMQICRRLFPTDSIHQHRPLHSLLENLPVRVDLGVYQPRLLGTSTEEAAFTMAEDIAVLINATLARVEPAIKALYGDDWNEATRLAGLSFTDGSQLLADVMHTAWCLGTQTFPEEDVARLNAAPIDLACRVPSACSQWSPAPYFFKQIHRSPYSYDMDMNPVCLALLDDDGGRQPIAAGYGIGIRAHVEHDLPPAVYDTFAARIGLHADLPSTGPVHVSIHLDDTPLFSRIYTSADSTDALELDVSQGGRLRIASEPADDIDALAAIACHVVVAQPCLHKKAS